MMPDPLFTYTALAFVLGVVIGIGLCGNLVRRANRTLTEARSMLQLAQDRHEQAVGFYQECIRTSETIRDALRRMDRGRS